MISTLLLFVGTQTAPSQHPEVMYTKLATAGAVIVLLLVYNYFSKSKTIQHD